MIRRRRGSGAALEVLDDVELARRAAGGDEQALEVVLRRHQALVYRVCRRLCPNDADALDATQEALLRVATRIDRFDGRAAFTTWLYRVVTNACLDELRRVARRIPTSPLPPDSAAPEDDRAPTSVELLDPAEEVAQRLELDAALARLATEFRAAVVLRDVVGLDYGSIADILDVPAGTVRSRIARGRAHLARELGLGDEPRAGAGNRTTESERPTRGEAVAPDPASRPTP